MSYVTSPVAINSGPLFIRTVGNGSLNNSYVLGQYDKPVGTNYILTTSNNGLLVPTRDPFLNSLLVTSTITASRGTFNLLSTNTLSSNTVSTAVNVCSTLQAGSATLSTLLVQRSMTVNGPAIFNKEIVNIVGGNPSYTLDSPAWWGKHIFVFNQNEHTNMNLPLFPPFPPDGSFMYITNGVSERNVIVTNVQGGDVTLPYLSSIAVIFNSTVENWYGYSR